MAKAKSPFSFFQEQTRCREDSQMRQRPAQQAAERIFSRRFGFLVTVAAEAAQSVPCALDICGRKVILVGGTVGSVLRFEQGLAVLRIPYRKLDGGNYSVGE